MIIRKNESFDEYGVCLYDSDLSWTYKVKNGLIIEAIYRFMHISKYHILKYNDDDELTSFEIRINTKYGVDESISYRNTSFDVEYKKGSNEVISYSDSMGNHFRSDWGIPFVFNDVINFRVAELGFIYHQIDTFNHSYRHSSKDLSIF